MIVVLSSRGHRRIAVRCCTALALAAFVVCCSGCTSTNSLSWFNHGNNECCLDGLFTGWRDHVWAKRAYYRCYPVCEHLHPSHFRRGFIAGYNAVCAGEDTYLPAVAPEEYWGYKYQTADGGQMVTAWFDGYPEGVRAAAADGAGAYRDLQVSSALNEAMTPSQDVWAPYSTPEMDGQPPILSGEELPPMPLPESMPSASSDAMSPQAMNAAIVDPNQVIVTQPDGSTIPVSSGTSSYPWGPTR